jgi:hypothetical protein
MNIDETLKLLISRDRPVPIPGRLPSEQEVSQVEHDLSFKFPSEYRKFQLEASKVRYGILELGLVFTDLMPYINLRKIAENGWSIGVPRTHLPFCSDNGNFHTISIDGKIGFYDHDEHSHNEFEMSFNDWILEEWLEEES